MLNKVIGNIIDNEKLVTITCKRVQILYYLFLLIKILDYFPRQRILSAYYSW